MKSPLAFTVLENCAHVQRISIPASAAAALSAVAHVDGPAILMVREASMLPNMPAGVFDLSDVVLAVGGNWEETILIVGGASAVVSEARQEPLKHGDALFIATAGENMRLAQLAEQTIVAIRKAGIDGNLVEKGGRWVNQPLNSFTLKVQPRADNLAFTLYGNPSSFETEKGFLLQDQNSYSRGWVRNANDAERFVNLVKNSHTRRTGRQ